MISSLLTFFAVGLVTLIVAGIALAIVGTVFSITIGLTSFLLFKVAPILLVGWLVVKVIEKSRRSASLTDSDRQWLEGE